MPRMILPADKMDRILRQRRAWGADRKDEVWNGVYVMAPDADDEHESFSFRLAYCIQRVMEVEGQGDVHIATGGNVSDLAEDWTQNFRCPDVQAYLPGNPAEAKGSHHLGGPDFAVEVISPGDRSREKFGFYASVGVRELLLVDRRPWELELYRLVDGEYGLAEVSSLEDPAILRSAVLPISLQLVSGRLRPGILVTHEGTGASWTA